MGQTVWYMGWFAPMPRPSLPRSTSKTSHTVFPEVPMVKIGTITAIDPSRPDSFEIRVDGAYNLRIASGSDCLLEPGQSGLRGLGRYREERAGRYKRPIKTDPPEKIVKSGILKGYSFDIVVTQSLTNCIGERAIKCCPELQRVSMFLNRRVSTLEHPAGVPS